MYFLTVNYYSTQLIQKLINSITLTTQLFQQIIIINNSTDDHSIYQLQNNTTIIIDSETNLGYGKACNLGLNWIYDQNPQAIIWLINPDAYLFPDSLEKAHHFLAKNPEFSILGTTVYEPTGKIWFGGGKFIPETGKIIANEFISNTETSTTDWVTGCSMLINFKNFKNCPEFDKDYFLYYEDFDFCRRYVKQGHKIAITQKISVIHQPSSITNKNPELKLEHSIYSYLLSLEKHTNKLVLIYRLLRITIAALVKLPINYQIARVKIKAIRKFIRYNCMLGRTKC
ncbi:MAG: glycosyltransferase family 2 protein [Okeania sp. SIO2G4]|nr:glycosyltransferase family 2 protein [Okeania sp. SIO2H7]NEP74171.1 glycosyltransferase family 2 protein [Okeania sp. SIO2G5]NEP95121.1 glycosyltransferase family 2 protein [Okeania sp. SIO2F5]NEQ93606.1 glycosyltransferase family 2 protein [Okeania sp. SIO2G4]